MISFLVFFFVTNAQNEGKINRIIPQAGVSNETGNADTQDSGLPNSNEDKIGLNYVSLEKLSATGQVYYPPDLNSLCYSSKVSPAYDKDYFSQY